MKMKVKVFAESTDYLEYEEVIEVPDDVENINDYCRDRVRGVDGGAFSPVGIGDFDIIGVEVTKVEEEL